MKTHLPVDEIEKVLRTQNAFPEPCDTDLPEIFGQPAADCPATVRFWLRFGVDAVNSTDVL
jgi:hypothetical protein